MIGLQCGQCGIIAEDDGPGCAVCGHGWPASARQQKMGQADSTRDMIPGFGAAVRSRREQAGLTLQQFAEKVGTHFTAISKVERGQRAPSLRLAVDIANALNVTMDVLLQDAARHAG